MTHLRKLMLDELQRRNYALNTVRAYIHAVEDFAKYFHRSPENIFASTRFTCFVTARSRQERSKFVPLLCVFFSARHSGDHIFPITSRFPSGTGGYPQY